MKLTQQWARAIVQANQPLALDSDPLRHLEVLRLSDHVELSPGSSDATCVYNAALLAAHALDFDAADAACIAMAWRSQFTRLGVFDSKQWPVEAQDFGLQPWPSEQGFAPCPKNLGLYAVMPDAAWVKRMADAGVPTVQLRLKTDDQDAVRREVASAVQAVKGAHCLLFINDHWQAAIDAGAYGVHLGQEDLAQADLVAIREAGLRLGISSHGYAEMLRAHAAKPSYIAIGAVYATTLKRMATPPQGPHRLARYAALLKDYATVAIGGIDLARLPEVQSGGVGSVAVVRALLAASNPEQAVASFLKQLRS
jgi:thiamine-phosphate pyrophosphorylase